MYNEIQLHREQKKNKSSDRRQRPYAHVEFFFTNSDNTRRKILYQNNRIPKKILYQNDRIPKKILYQNNRIPKKNTVPEQ